MKFKITESCIVNNKHVERGSVIEVDKETMFILMASKRGRVVPDGSTQATDTRAEAAADDADARTKRRA